MKTYHIKTAFKPKLRLSLLWFLTIMKLIDVRNQHWFVSLSETSPFGDRAQNRHWMWVFHHKSLIFAPLCLHLFIACTRLAYICPDLFWHLLWPSSSFHFTSKPPFYFFFSLNLWLFFFFFPICGPYFPYTAVMATHLFIPIASVFLRTPHKFYEHFKWWED